MFQFSNVKLTSLLLVASLGLAACGDNTEDKDKVLKPDFSFTKSSLKIKEGNVGNTKGFAEVRLSRQYDQDITIGYKFVDGTAKNGVDYEGESGTITVPAKTQKINIAYEVVGNYELQENRDFSITLTSVSIGEVVKSKNEVVVTIEDDDELLPVASLVNEIAVDEGDGVSDGKVTITLNKTYPLDVIVFYEFQDGTAQQGTDFWGEGGSVVIPSGKKLVVIPFKVYGNLTYEPENKDFYFVLTSAEGGTISEKNKTLIVIKEDDEPEPAVSIAASNSIAEGNYGVTEGTVRVSLSKEYKKDIEVEFDFSNGSAIMGEDFNAFDDIRKVTIPQGAKSADIRFSIKGDTVYEDNEIFYINLVSVTNASINPKSSKSTITIINDEKIPDLGFGVDLIAVSEDIGTVTLPITLSHESAFDAKARINFSGTATFDGDYTYQGSREITFEAGETEKEISIEIILDQEKEGKESIVVTIEHTEGAGLAVDRKGEYTNAVAKVIIMADTVLNDTGLMSFSDENSMLDSEPFGYEGQDASFGRDANPETNSSVDGDAGFSFTEIDRHGNHWVNSPEKPEWRCVEDRVTGLVWEAKADYYNLPRGGAGDEGISEDDITANNHLWPSNQWQAYNFTYGWHNDDTTNNGGSSGSVRTNAVKLNKKKPVTSSCGFAFDESRKADLYCDTQSYVEEMNYRGVCGFKDWRLPEISELRSISNYDFKGGVASPDTILFPRIAMEGDESYGVSHVYFSATPSANNDGSAWCFDYIKGESVLCNKGTKARVILVRNKK